MADLVILAPDYAADVAAKIADGSLPVGSPVPLVTYCVDVPLRCNGDGCPRPNFTASFPATQRVVSCLACDREVFIPERYRETP